MKFCPVCGKEVKDGACPSGCDLSKYTSPDESKKSKEPEKKEKTGEQGTEGEVLSEKELRDMVANTAKETVTASIKEVIDPLKDQMKATENKLIARMKDVPDYLGKARVSAEDGEKFLKILGALADGDKAQAKLISGTTEAGGRILIPTTIAGVVQSIAPVYGVVRRDTTPWTMATDKENVPKWITEMPDVWEGEGNIIKAWGGEPFGQTELVTQRHGVIVPITRQMMRYPRVAVMNVIVEKMGESLGYGAERVTFVGLSDGNDGWSIPGIINTANVPAKTTTGATAGTLAGADMDACIASVKGRALNRARFYMNHAVLFNVVANLKDDDGQYIYQPAKDGRPANWRGFPIEWTDALPASPDPDEAFIVFGNLSYVLFGTSQEMFAESAREASLLVRKPDNSEVTINLFQQGIQAVKVEEEIDIKVAFPEALAFIKTAVS